MSGDCGSCLRLRNKLTAHFLYCSVGLITNGTQAEKVLKNGEADVVSDNHCRHSHLAPCSPSAPHPLTPQISVAREFIRDSELVFNWAQELGVAVTVPVQQERGFTRMYKKADAKPNGDKTLVERITDAVPAMPTAEQPKRPLSDLVPDVTGAFKNGANEGNEGKESAP